MLVSVNKRLYPAKTARIAIDDRGFTLGDGVFETVRVSDGHPLRLAAHLDRLRTGAHLLDLLLPPLEHIGAEVTRVLRANHLQNAVVRITVSRGSGQRGLTPIEGAVPTLVIAAAPFRPYPARWYSDGVRAIVTQASRNEHSPLSRIKSLSYTEQVLARIEAQHANVDLGLLCNTQGDIVCADCANLFVVRDQHLLTPPTDAGALPGIARSVMLQIAGGLGLIVEERKITLADVYGADELLLTNVLLEVAPVVQLDECQIGNGKPGDYARLLRRVYRLAVGLGNR